MDDLIKIRHAISTVERCAVSIYSADYQIREAHVNKITFFILDSTFV